MQGKNLCGIGEDSVNAPPIRDAAPLPRVRPSPDSVDEFRAGRIGQSGGDGRAPASRDAWRSSAWPIWHRCSRSTCPTCWPNLNDSNRHQRSARRSLPDVIGATRAVSSVGRSRAVHRRVAVVSDRFGVGRGKRHLWLRCDAHCRPGVLEAGRAWALHRQELAEISWGRTSTGERLNGADLLRLPSRRSRVRNPSSALGEPNLPEVVIRPARALVTLQRAARHRAGAAGR